jgi:predicted PurR-regulated permease PerM
VAPPSWRRVGKRALLFGPLIFVAFSVIDTGQSIAVRLATAVVYTAFFVPLMYLMDRTMYRTYLRRTGQDSPQRQSRKR